MHRTISLTADPAWPWSLPGLGVPLLVGIGGFIALVTVWTYLGSRHATPTRVAVVLALRLTALVVSLATVLRPSVAVREEQKLPSTLVLALDRSASMTIQDEVGNRSRWEELRRIMQTAQPLLDQLRDEQGTSIIVQTFAEDVRDDDPQTLPDGKRTDIGGMLATLHERFGGERRFRGLLVVTDGIDNGTRFQPLQEAGRWRGVGPIYTFSLGSNLTELNQRDIHLVEVSPEPSPVPVKGRLTVRATADAPGFVNATVTARLLIDDKEVLAQPVTLPRAKDNMIELVTDAPDVPGEVKVTVRLDPLPGEVTARNNEIGTYLTVTKEGLSVLFVDQLRYERRFVRQALAREPRVRLFEATVQTDDPSPLELFDLNRQHYDVILLGDVSARKLTAGRPDALVRLADAVRTKGVGLMAIGGVASLGHDWIGTPLADLLPVRLDPEQVSKPAAMRPTRDGIRHFALRLAPTEADNEALWAKLPRLRGYTRLGEPKPGAIVLARSGDPVSGPPLLVGQTVGQGRVLAFAADTTHDWRGYRLTQDRAGLEAFNRFWRQIVLWLARQEEAQGNAYVRLDARRLPAGSKQGLVVGLRGKTGVELAEARYEVSVTAPDGTSSPVTVTRERDGHRGSYWKTDLPGEYRVVLKAAGKDVDGAAFEAEATGRFLVYQDETELLRQAADLDFLAKLAAAGGGQSFRADDLPAFLRQLLDQPPTQDGVRVRHWPDWRTTQPGPFVPAWFVLFVALLCLEWGLRRVWGMV